MTTSNHDPLEIEFLGTGTSTGVPQIRCRCAVCRSTDPRDRRLRASAIVTYRGRRLLIDCGPDFRTQILRAWSDDLDALLLTHIHYDHVGGLDDLRAYCLEGHFPIYARQDVIDDLHARLPYCFALHPYPGVPQLDVTAVREGETFRACGIGVMPLPVMHYHLPILGYRIGPLAYITDASHLDDHVVAALRGAPLLVLNALRHEPHLSHFCLRQALDIVERVAPGRALLTHMSHGIGLHARTQAGLPPGVDLAYDGLRVTVP